MCSLVYQKNFFVKKQNTCYANLLYNPPHRLPNQRPYKKEVFMEEKNFATSYPLLSKERSFINKRGKPTGRYANLCTKSGVVIGSSEDRKQVSAQILKTLETLLANGYHFVLQASEGDGIKIVGNDAMTRAILLFRRGCMQIFCLKARWEDAEKLCASTEIPRNTINIRQGKTDYVYVDFDEVVNPGNIANFILSLPESVQCKCGHKNDRPYIKNSTQAA
jgi:hypothetical protein